ncbi:MAG: serine/threonine-protein kinase [Pirellulaceae bacterium]|nr:serine/threonine-protein kinase [Pirellulaceae bacterium]
MRYNSPMPTPPAPTSDCPRCGAALAADAPDGLCPACLMQQGFGEQDPKLAATDVVEPTAFPIAELSSRFPDLDILNLVGEGGMGAVYRARQKRLDRTVALKVIRPQRRDDPGFSERFQREAKTLARLSHPHIPAVYDFGEVDGVFYLLMEYVDGENLRTAISQQAVPAERALSIVGQICDALQYAHDQGVVHRDIKPENVMLTDGGHVKIADFGLAKLTDGLQQPLTQTRHMMGTPNYMSPEQMERPQAVDHRADLYSLGVVLYEMLTGELPLGRFDPPSKKADVDRKLDDVVLRSLEKEPSKRYQRASDIKSDVENFSQRPSRHDHQFDVGWWLDIVGIGVAIGAGILIGKVITQTREPSWLFSLIPVGLFVMWYPWNLMRNIAAVVTVVVAAGCIGVAVIYTNSAWPMVGLFGIGGFLAFMYGEEEAGDEDESELESRQLVGLSDRELDFVRSLRKFGDEEAQTYVLPNIPADQLAGARNKCDLKPSERVLALIDLTMLESAEYCVLVTSSGLHCRSSVSGDGVVQHFVPHEMLAKHTIVDGGDCVHVGDDIVISKGWSDVETETLTNFLLTAQRVAGAAW